MPTQIKNFISDQEMAELEKQGNTTPAIKAPPAFISDADMAKMQPKKKGFLRSFAEGIVRPFGEFAVSLENAAEATEALVKGKGAAVADQKLAQNIKLPFIGETKPALTGQEGFVEGTKKMAGYGLDIGSNFVGMQGLGQLGKAGAKGAALQAVKQGAKYGAATGAINSGGVALEENKGAREVATDTATGGIFGGVLGALGGAASGAGGKFFRKVGQAVKNRTPEGVAEKAASEAMDVLTPELSKTKGIQAVKRTGTEVTNELGEIALKTGKREHEMAEAVKDLVTPKKTMSQNLESVKGGLAREAENAKALLQSRDVPFTRAELKKHLSGVKLPSSVKRDDYLRGLYDDVTERFFDLLEENPKKLSSILDNRKALDKIVEEEIPNIWSETRHSPLQKSFTSFRNSLHDFIEKKAGPEIGGEFRDSLKKQSLMYDAIDNLAPKAFKEVGTNAPGRILQKHPILKKIGRDAALGAGAALGGGAIMRGLLEN